MKKITKVVKTNLSYKEIPYSFNKKKGVLVVYQVEGGLPNLVEKSKLPKNFEDISDNMKVDAFFSVESKDSFVVVDKKTISKLVKSKVGSKESNDLWNYPGDFLMEEITSENINEFIKERQVVCVANFGWDHTYSVFPKQFPFVPNQTIDYIGTCFTNKTLDWSRLDEIKSHLESLPFVKSVEPKKIPRYNQDYGRDRYLEVVFQHDDEVVSKIHETNPKKFKAYIEGKDLISYYLDMPILDIYGLKKFLFEEDYKKLVKKDYKNSVKESK